MSFGINVNFENQSTNEINPIDSVDPLQDYYACYSLEDIPESIRPILSENEEIENQDIYAAENNINTDDSTEPIQLINGPMDSAWPMYCHDTRHTSRSPYSTAGNVGFNKWWYKCKWYIEGSAAIDKAGIIYFGGGGYEKALYLYALYPNGTLKWKCEVDNLIEAGPAIAEDGTIYVGDSSCGYGTLYAICPNGTLKWKYQTFGEMYSSPVIGPDGIIYIGDGNNYINAINPNGTLKWRFQTGFIVYSSPAIGSDGTVYCGSHDNYLYALYLNNGTLKWKYKTGHWIRTSPCIGDDGTVYCVSLDGYLHAVYPNNGTRKWRTDVGAGTSPTIGQDGTIYAGYDTLYAVNPFDGSVKWNFDVMGTMRGGTPCTSADGTIYVGISSGGNLITINPDGTEKWRQHIGTCEFAPVISEDGTVYIGSSIMEETRPGAFKLVGYLYAFNKKENNAPSAPSIIGPSNGNSKRKIDYNFTSFSPLGNDVYYYIDWGDGDYNRDVWIGPYKSGEIVTINHSWKYKGDYIIKARVKDTDNLWSDWSEKTVTVPRNRAISSVWMRFIEMFPILQRLFSLIK